MARIASMMFITVNESVRQCVATLRARQDHGQLNPRIERFDDATHAARDPDESLHLDPRDYGVSVIHLIDLSE